MPRPNKRRTEVSPTTVRLSPGEVEQLVVKAAAAGMTKAGALRAAIQAWNPPPSERITLSVDAESVTNEPDSVDNVIRGEHG